MSYQYEVEKPALLTDVGSRLFLRARDAVLEQLVVAGAVSAEKMLELISRKVGSIDSWLGLAVLDRMVEVGDLLEVTNEHSSAAQHRIFIRRRW